MMNKQNDAQRSASVKSPVNRRVWIALGALCIASFLGHLALFPQLPDIVPTHWDAAGNVNGWSSRMATLGLDLLPLGLLALFYALPKIDPRGKAYERMGSFYTGFVTLFTVFLICMTWTTELTVFGIIPQNESPIGIFTGVTVGIGLMLLGNYLPKVKRNYSFGCKPLGRWTTTRTGVSPTASEASPWSSRVWRPSSPACSLARWEGRRSPSSSPRS